MNLPAEFDAAFQVFLLTLLLSLTFKRISDKPDVDLPRSFRPTGPKGRHVLAGFQREIRAPAFRRTI